MNRLILIVLLALTATPAYAQFQASTVTTQDAYADIRRQAVATKAFLATNRALLVAPTSSANVPIAVIRHLSDVIPRLDALAVTPGLPQYAKDQHSNQSYDVVAQYNAMKTLMVSVRDTLITMFPKDANGFLLYQTLNASGVLVTRTFAAAQVAPAVVAIDALIASIQ